MPMNQKNGPGYMGQIGNKFLNVGGISNPDYGFNPDVPDYGFNPDVPDYGFNPDVPDYGFNPDVTPNVGGISNPDCVAKPMQN